jgi:hypothetical protein
MKDEEDVMMACMDSVLCYQYYRAAAGVTLEGEGGEDEMWNVAWNGGYSQSFNPQAPSNHLDLCKYTFVTVLNRNHPLPAHTVLSKTVQNCPRI